MVDGVKGDAIDAGSEVSAVRPERRADRLAGWRRLFRGDATIWLIVLVLSCVSVLVVSSVSEMLAYRQYGGETFAPVRSHVVKLVLAWGAIFLFQMLPTRHYRKWALVLVLGGIGLLGYTLLFGRSTNLATRWVEISESHGFQPSEFMKLLVVIYLSCRLARGVAYANNWRRGLGEMLLIVSLSCGLIFRDNASTALFIFGVSMLMLVLGSVSWQNLAILLLLGAVSGMVLLFVVMPQTSFFTRGATWSERIESYLGEGSYQSQQAEIAIAGGMLWGKGAGNSSQRLFLPEPQSDFVYACIVEEFGLIVGVLVLALYIVLLWRVRRIVVRCGNNLYQAYLCAGLGLLIGLQAFAHIFISVGLFPVTGLTLPLVSTGGTSLVVTGVALGIIQSVARQQAKELYEGERAEV